MNEFLDYEIEKKTIKTLNLEDFSIEDLNKYIIELKNEIKRVDTEIIRKKELLINAQDYFK